MISVEESKKYLQGLKLTDGAIEKLRDSLYLVIGEILDNLYETKTTTSNNPI